MTWEYGVRSTGVLHRACAKHSIALRIICRDTQLDSVGSLPRKVKSFSIRLKFPCGAPSFSSSQLIEIITIPSKLLHKLRNTYILPLSKMSALLPVAVYGLKVPAGDVMIPALMDLPATVRFSLTRFMVKKINWRTYFDLVSHYYGRDRPHCSPRI